MQLTAEEQAWLDAYRKALAEDFPDLVEELLIFGSKARGEAGPDSDLDVLLVIREGDSQRKRAELGFTWGAGGICEIVGVD
jgi:predicted nucleotidyltransferase